jgi:hypothetical protein
MNDLIEVMPFEYQIVESENGGFRVEGIFQRSDVENANKRVYPRSIWERELKEARVAEALATRSMFGELDHPSDGKTKLQRVSHVITDLNLQEDGVMTGAAEILPTPNGQILRSLFESGVQVGISSRGSGSVQNGRVQEDFKLNTFDFVARPSTPGALPRPSGESKGSKTEDVIDASVKVVEDGTEVNDFNTIDTIMRELNSYDLTEDASGRDFNAVARDTIMMHNAVHEEDFELTPELVEAVAYDTLVLGHELTRLAAEYPEYRAVVTDLLGKVDESRAAVINRPTVENTKEEPMDRLQFIKERLQEAAQPAIDEAEELRQELNQLTDDELYELALETGVISSDVEEDDDDAEDEVTPEQLFDYIDELENDLAEASELIEKMAGALEEADNSGNGDAELKYEAALGIIQETVSRFQLLAEAVGGEEKANQLMEAHLQALESGEDVNESITESDEADDIEKLIGGDLVEDAKMARYKELSESALERTGLN